MPKASSPRSARWRAGRHGVEDVARSSGRRSRRRAAGRSARGTSGSWPAGAELRRSAGAVIRDCHTIASATGAPVARSQTTWSRAGWRSRWRRCAPAPPTAATTSRATCQLARPDRLRVMGRRGPATGSRCSNSRCAAATGTPVAAERDGPRRRRALVEGEDQAVVSPRQPVRHSARDSRYDATSQRLPLRRPSRARRRGSRRRRARSTRRDPAAPGARRIRRASTSSRDRASSCGPPTRPPPGGDRSPRRAASARSSSRASAITSGASRRSGRRAGGDPSGQVASASPIIARGIAERPRRLAAIWASSSRGAAPMSGSSAVPDFRRRASVRPERRVDRRRGP